MLALFLRRSEMVADMELFRITSVLNKLAAHKIELEKVALIL